MSEDHNEDFYPDGDAPQGDELVTDPMNLSSYAELLRTGTHPKPLSETEQQLSLNAFLQDAITDMLPVDPSKDEVRHAVSAAAAMLWGDGYRRTSPTHHVEDFQ